jgi:predicted dienelactone hydrolase
VVASGALTANRRARLTERQATATWRRRGLRALGIVAAAVAWVVAVALPSMLPVFEMPAPTGPHRIGTATRALLDASRDEPFTTDPGDRRELLLKLWYPAEPRPGASREGFFAPSDVIPRELASALRLPGWFFDHLALVRTHSIADALVLAATTPFPVVVFSHGFGQGFPNQNQALCEELASHGYVVVSIGHPYESLVLAYPDGRLTRLSDDQVRRVTANLIEVKPLYERLQSERSAPARRELVDRLRAASPLFADSLRLWVADTRTTVDWLAAIAAGTVDHPLATRLDMTRLGVAGMSFGGATAWRFCAEDRRCRAAVNLDGFQYGDDGNSLLAVPLMLVTSADDAGVTTAPYADFTESYCEVVVDGAKHLDFSDFPLISPLFRLTGVLGTIAGRRAIEIHSRYPRAFLDLYLRNIQEPLLDGATAAQEGVHLVWRGREPHQGGA